MTYMSDYQKVEFNCMSFQAEMLKSIHSLQIVGDFKKLLKM